MIIPLIPSPTPGTPAAPVDAPEAQLDFSALLAESELSVLHLLQTEQDAVPTDEAPVILQEESGDGTETALAVPVMAPLATTQEATSTSWIQTVAGGSEVRSATAEPTVGSAPVATAPQPTTTADSPAPLPAPGEIEDAAAEPALTTTQADDTSPAPATPTPVLDDTVASQEQRADSTSPVPDRTSPSTRPIATDDAGPAEQSEPIADYGLELIELESNSAPVTRQVAVEPNPQPTSAVPDTTSTESAANQPIENADMAEMAEMADLPDAGDVAAGEISAPTAPAPVATTNRPMIESATLQRVEAAIEQLENTPPPRTLVLDLDDEGGVRVRLSSSADGVQVDVQSGEGQERDAAWEQDLREQLAQRGFQLDTSDVPSEDGAEPATASPTRPTDDAIRL